MPSVSQIKQELYDTIHKILKAQGEFEVSEIAARLALQVGFKEQTVLDIVEMMKKSKLLIIDKYGFARPFKKEVLDDSQNDDKV